MRIVNVLLGVTTIAALAGCAGTGDKPLTADGLFEKHMQASYGSKGVGAYPSVTQHGTLFIDDFGIEAPIVTKIMAPSNFVFETEVMGMAMSQGCNETTCWSQQPGQGTADLEGEMKEGFRMQSDPQAFLHMDQYYDSLEVVPSDDPEAKDYTVKAVNSFGREHFYYFSKETGLLSGMTITTDSPMGVMTQETVMKDYKDFGGVMYPAAMEQSTPMAHIRITTDSVTYEPLSKSDFVRPA